MDNFWWIPLDMVNDSPSTFQCVWFFNNPNCFTRFCQHLPSFSAIPFALLRAPHELFVATWLHPCCPLIWHRHPRPNDASELRLIWVLVFVESDEREKNTVLEGKPITKTTIHRDTASLHKQLLEEQQYNLEETHLQLVHSDIMLVQGSVYSNSNEMFVGYVWALSSSCSHVAAA